MNIEARLAPRSVDITSVLAEVPKYIPQDGGFMTGRELENNSWQLLEKHADMVTDGKLGYEHLGESAEGRSIDLLRVGAGKRKIMLMGTPHPNEPVGTLTCEFLSQYLCDNPEMLEEMDATFLFVKNADPDGLARNEGWLKPKEGMSPVEQAVDYATNLYRPFGGKDIDWSFPIQYDTYKYTSSFPETAALQRALDTHQPEAFIDLHNVGFGGLHWNANTNLPSIFAKLQRLPLRHDIPLKLTAPELPYQLEWGDGIFSIPYARTEYDDAKQHFPENPKVHMFGGAKPSEYLEGLRDGDSLCIEPEVPFLTADAFADTSKSPYTKRQAIELGVAGVQTRLTSMQEHFDAIEPLLGNTDNLHKEAVAAYLQKRPNFLRSQVANIQQPKYDQPATNAYAFNEIHAASFYDALRLGQVYRLAMDAGEISRAEQIKAEITTTMENINNVSQIRKPDVADLVAIQAGTALTALKQAA